MKEILAWLRRLETRLDKLAAQVVRENMNDYYMLVARGLITGQISVNKFGRNPDVDVGTEDIWSQGGTWVAPTAARVHNLASTSANDTAAGTGARTLTVNGLNGSYVDTTETITLNGVANVATANSYVIIHRMIVQTAGSVESNVGTITATAVTDGTISAAIVIGKNQTQVAIYQIPAGYTGYLSQYYGGFQGGAGAACFIELFGKAFGGVYALKGTLTLRVDGSSFDVRSYKSPLKFTEKSIIKLTATSDAVNSNVVGAFDLILVAN